MGRPSKTRHLSIYMNGELVGIWTITAQGRQEFRYDDAWRSSAAARSLSLSLPLAPATYAYTGDVVEHFFDNLLPDSLSIRQRIQQRFRTESTAPFALLAEIGRDCVGAIQLLPEGVDLGQIRSINAEPLTDADVEKILRAVPAPPAFGQKEREAEFRISLAGAQEKTALLFHKEKWCRPLGTTPTTHLFKLPLGVIGQLQIDMSFSIENEWLCSRIVHAFGLPIARTEIARFGDQKVLIVERFDRKLSSDKTWLIRLPVEDLCQATGRSPGAKYESEGGPSIEEIMRLLLGARDAFVDRRTFLKTQVLFWMMAAIDGHAKNFSIFIEPEGRYSLTPIYDVLSAYPVMGHGARQFAPEKLDMAMAVSGKDRHYEWARIQRRHWVTTAEHCNAGKEIEPIISELVERTPQVIAEVSENLPAGFPEQVAGPILEGLARSAQKLQ